MAVRERPDTPAAAGVTGRRDRLIGLRDAARSPGVIIGALALLLALMTWPLPDLQPQVGLDGSWVTGLHRSAFEHRGFGSDIVFTFGPLGFLREPVLAYPWTTRLAFGYVLALQFALCLALLLALWRSFGSLLIAAPLALLIASLVDAEPAWIVAFAVVIALVHGDVPRRALPATLLALGVLAGIQLLAKLNVGITVLALCVIALAALRDDRRRALAWFAGGVGSALITGWALTGQSPADVADYLGAAPQIVGGYSEAMGLDDPESAWALWVVPVLVGIGAAIALRGDPLAAVRSRVAMTALWLLLAFTAYKSGFVRHGPGHALYVFATILGGLAVLPLARLARTTAALVLLLAGVALLGAGRLDPSVAVAPIQRAEAFVDQARLLADGSSMNAAIVGARRRMVAEYRLDPATLAELNGHSVHVEPYEANVTWAHRLAWKPPPVFQSYSAYTAKLDERNAQALASPAGPDRILRHNLPAIDARNRTWESPAAMRAVLCHFQPLTTTAEWQVLGRVTNRCGTPRLLAERSARWGQDVAIPAAPSARSAVYAEIDGVSVKGLEKLVNVAYRAAPRELVLDGNRPYRLVPGTARNGLLLRVPAALDFPAPFSLDQAAQRLSVLRRRASGRGITVRFYAVALTPPRAARR
jgi:hypothetical protein